MNSKNHLFLPVGFHWSKNHCRGATRRFVCVFLFQLQSIEHTLKTLIQFLTFQQEYNATF